MPELLDEKTFEGSYSHQQLGDFVATLLGLQAIYR